MQASSRAVGVAAALAVAAAFAPAPALAAVPGAHARAATHGGHGSGQTHHSGASRPKGSAPAAAGASVTASSSTPSAPSASPTSPAAAGTSAAPAAPAAPSVTPSPAPVSPSTSGTAPATGSSSPTTTTTVPTATTTQSGSSCLTSPLTQPFTAWGDSSDYELAPGGDFITGSAPGWTFAGGASLVSAGDPLGLQALKNAAVVSLPAGASVQSPFFCISSAEPTARFMDLATSSGANLSVQFIYTLPLGLSSPLAGGSTSPTSTWGPSAVLQTGSALAQFVPGATQMAVRITAGRGGAELDDLFIDPRMAER